MFHEAASGRGCRREFATTIAASLSSLGSGSWWARPWRLVLAGNAAAFPFAAAAPMEGHAVSSCRWIQLPGRPILLPGENDLAGELYLRILIVAGTSINLARI